MEGNTDVRRIALDQPIPKREIAALLGPLPDGAPEVFSAIATDSRVCLPGDLFFALGGGEDYLPEATLRGAIAVSARPGAGRILVRDTAEAFLALAGRYRSKFRDVKVVAVTGSYGKTTTKEYLKEMLSRCADTAATAGNLNNRIGVAATLFSLKKSDRFAVIEAGMNHPGELSELSEAISPDLAIITGIGTAHIGNFGSREAIAKAKLEITDGMTETAERLLVPAEEPLLGVPGALTVSLADRKADFFLLPDSVREDGSHATFFHDGRGFPLRFPIPGKDALSCLAFAVSAATLLGCPFFRIREAILALETPVRRFPEKAGDLILLNDWYNSSPEAVLAAFDALDLIRDRPRSALLGDMEELGAETEPLHRMVGREAAKHNLRKLYLFGRYAPFYARGAREGGMAEENIFCNSDPLDPEKTASAVAATALPGEIVLCKASHAADLGRVTARIADLCAEQNKRKEIPPHD